MLYVDAGMLYVGMLTHDKALSIEPKTRNMPRDRERDLISSLSSHSRKGPHLIALEEFNERPEPTILDDLRLVFISGGEVAKGDGAVFAHDYVAR